MPFMNKLFDKTCSSRKDIKRAKESAKKAYPEAKKFEYVKPEFIKLVHNEIDLSFWTPPEIEIHL